jgi:hypothetical protein
MHSEDQAFASSTSHQAGPDFGPPELRDEDDEDIVMAEVIEDSASDDSGIDSAHGGIEQWHEIQSTFVDDPRAAVRRAAEAVDRAITALAADLRHEMSDLGAPARDGSGENTERLRIASQRYRLLWQGVKDLTASSPPRAT